MSTENPIHPNRRTGNEPFHSNNQSIGYTLLQCWQWNFSGLLGNTLRGAIAEFLVACDLGVADEIHAGEWNAYDVQAKSGLKIEVKSAAFVQNWHQKAPSKIRFGINPTKGWDASTNIYSIELKRQADVYIFALLSHQDRATIDALNVAQWDFYVLPTTSLNTKSLSQKTISLSVLQKLNPTKAKFGEILKAIEAFFPSP
jgi:hypothetical protein